MAASAGVSVAVAERFVPFSDVATRRLPFVAPHCGCLSWNSQHIANYNQAMRILSLLIAGTAALDGSTLLAPDQWIQVSEGKLTFNYVFYGPDWGPGDPIYLSSIIGDSWEPTNRPQDYGPDYCIAKQRAGSVPPIHVRSASRETCQALGRWLRSLEGTNTRFQGKSQQQVAPHPETPVNLVPSDSDSSPTFKTTIKDIPENAWFLHPTPMASPGATPEDDAEGPDTGRIAK